jgi:hypothetical protein
VTELIQDGRGIISANGSHFLMESELKWMVFDDFG